MQSEPCTPQNPESDTPAPGHLSKQSFSAMHDLRQTYRPQLVGDGLSKIAAVLEKPHESRNTADAAVLAHFVRESMALMRLSEEISGEFVRGLLKSGRVVLPGVNRLVYNRSDSVREVGVVVAGQLALLKQKQEENDEVLVSKEDVLDRLFQKAKVYRREQKRRQQAQNLSTTRRQTMSESLDREYDPLDHTLQPEQIKSYLNQNQLFGFRDLSAGQCYLQTCVSVTPQTALLVFSQSSIMNGLEAAFKDKLKKTTSVIKGIACFGFLDLDRVGQMIQNLATRKKKKGELIYRQGQTCTHFYLLTEGEVKITKQTHLFEQNPNILYSDRKKLMQQSLARNNNREDKLEQLEISKKVNKSLLPYANLTSMYNYRPMKKTIDIGLVTPNSLFGEEEYCDRKVRETNAVCSSIEVEYYEISIKKLEEIVGPKLMATFQKEVRSFVRKKLLYRQSQYANSILLQNSKNMNYFYFEDGKQVSSPRRFKISKINNVLLESKKKSPAATPVEPTITTFNFHKLERVAHRSQAPKPSVLVNPDEDDVHYTDPTELRIMDITHTWKLMKQKVDKQIVTSKKISPVRPIINLKKPLIASQFFYQADKQARRIQREHRKRISSLGRTEKLSTKGSVGHRSVRLNL